VASTVDVCNQALVKVGAERITSLADGTKQADTLAAIFDIKRDAELSAHPWTFAIKRVLLPASVTAPIGADWAYAYPMPSDYLSMVEVGGSYVFYDASSGTDPDVGGPLFGIEGGAVLTSAASPLFIRYVYRVTNSGLFPALFVEALACRLAAELCEALTQSTSKREAAWAEYKQAIRQAKRVNAIEIPPQRNPPTSWVRALEQT
jgi:hypothetical protein